MIEHNFLRIHGVESKNDIKEIDTGSRKIQSADLMEDIISITFSVQLLESANSTMESDNLRIGQADDKLSEALYQTTTQYLCEDTTFMIATKTLQNRDICESFKRVREEENGIIEENNENRNRKLQASRTKLLVDTLDAIADAKWVMSSDDSNIEWLEVGVQYEVLERSDQVLLLSHQSVDRLSPIEIIEQTAQLVTGNRIEEGTFGESLQNKDDRVKNVAILGKEIGIFSNKPKKPLPMAKVVIKPLHGLRVSGIILLVFLTVFVIALFSAGKARKKENIWEQKRLEEGHGGLATIQAVDAMLEVGRMKAKSTPVFPPNTVIE